MPILLAWAAVVAYAAVGLHLEAQRRKPRRPEIKIVRSFVVADKYPAFDHKAIIYVLDVDGVIVRLGHWSGRFDGPVAVLASHLKHLIKKYDLAAATTTESQQRGALARVRKMLRTLRERPLDAALEDELYDGWQVRQRGEYLFLFDTMVFFEMPKVKPTIAKLTAIAGYASWRNLRVARFTVRHRVAKLPFDFWVFHGPSDIEDHGAFGGSPNQISIAKRGYPRLARRVKRRRARKHGEVVSIAPGDTNGSARGDLHDWFEDTLGATSIWSQGRMPKQGTHGGGDRVIDDAFVWDVA